MFILMYILGEQISSWLENKNRYIKYLNKKMFPLGLVSYNTNLANYFSGPTA